MVHVIRHQWNPCAFEIPNLSGRQLSSGMVDGTFEGIYNDIKELKIDFSANLLSNLKQEQELNTIMYRAIHPYLKNDDYIANCNIHAGVFESGKIDFAVYPPESPEAVFVIEFSL